MNGLMEAVHKLWKTAHTSCELYSNLIQQCTSSKLISEGRSIHQHLRASRFASDKYLLNLLIKMYGNCACVEEACSTFEEIHVRNVFSWTMLLTAFACNGDLQEAEYVFERMPQRDVVSWTTMLSAYAQEGDVQEADQVFMKMPQRTIVSWNQIVSASAQRGRLQEARTLFERMPQRDTVSYNAVFHVYGLGTATELFHEMQQRTLVSWNAMLEKDVEGGDVEAACCLFERMPQRDVTSWNTMVRCEDEVSVEHFVRMPCRDIVAWTTVLHRYARVGRIDSCRETFERMPEWDSVSCNATMTAYVRCGRFSDAEGLFHAMPSRSSSTWNSFLQANADRGDLQRCREAFNRMPMRTPACFTAMITTLGKHEQLQEANSLFKNTPERDLVTWNAMVTVSGGKESLRLFGLMDLEGIAPDRVTYVGVFDACACIPALAEGRAIHRDADGLVENDLVVGTAAMKMYGKCGSVTAARDVFDKMKTQDAVAWGTMVAAYAENGMLENAFHLLREMSVAGAIANYTTFVSVLSACSHAGSLGDALMCFHSLQSDYDISVLPEHYSCIVDMLGRCGRLDDAKELLSNGCDESFHGWMALLGSCTTHGSVQQASFAADCALGLQPHNGAAVYLLLNNL